MTTTFDVAQFGLGTLPQTSNTIFIDTQAAQEAVVACQKYVAAHWQDFFSEAEWFGTADIYPRKDIADDDQTLSDFLAMFGWGTRQREEEWDEAIIDIWLVANTLTSRNLHILIPLAPYIMKPAYITLLPNEEDVAEHESGLRIRFAEDGSIVLEKMTVHYEQVQHIPAQERQHANTSTEADDD